VVTIETEPDEAEEDGNIEHAADAPVASEVDEDEEATNHAKREDDVIHKDSIDADTKEGLKKRLDKIKETIDVLLRERDVLALKVGLGLLTLEVSDDAHDIEAEASKKKEESNPADEAKDGEVVAKKKNEENVDGAEDDKRLDEILPKENLLHIVEELALLERLADHLARALTRARGSRSGLLLLLCRLLRCRFLRCRLCCRFLNRCGFSLFRHC